MEPRCKNNIFYRPANQPQAQFTSRSLLFSLFAHLHTHAFAFILVISHPHSCSPLYISIHAIALAHSLTHSLTVTLTIAILLSCSHFGSCTIACDAHILTLTPCALTIALWRLCFYACFLTLLALPPNLCRPVPKAELATGRLLGEIPAVVCPLEESGSPRISAAESREQQIVALLEPAFVVPQTQR